MHIQTYKKVEERYSNIRKYRYNVYKKEKYNFAQNESFAQIGVGINIYCLYFSPISCNLFIHLDSTIL